MESLLEDLRCEIARGSFGELRGEGQDEQGVDAGGGEEFDFFGEWCDEGLAGFGPNDAGGVWIEGDGDGGEAESAGAGDDFGDDPLVAVMHAVEIADGGDGWAEVAGDFCELAIDLHQAISNWRWRPS